MPRLLILGDDSNHRTSDSLHLPESVYSRYYEMVRSMHELHCQGLLFIFWVMGDYISNKLLMKTLDFRLQEDQDLVANMAFLDSGISDPVDARYSISGQ